MELYEEELSFLFVLIAQDLIDYPLRFCYLSYLTAKIRKSRQLVFEGRIVAEEDYGDWNDRPEPFKAIVTDKRMTKQGIEIKIWIGDYAGEGNLSEIFA